VTTLRPGVFPFSARRRLRGRWLDSKAGVLVMMCKLAVGFVLTFCLDLVIAAEAIPTACSCPVSLTLVVATVQLQEGAMYFVQYLPALTVDTRTGSSGMDVDVGRSHPHPSTSTPFPSPSPDGHSYIYKLPSLPSLPLLVVSLHPLFCLSHLALVLLQFLSQVHKSSSPPLN
jgi:hypothetical protein